jgi:hypothetical protein
MVLVPDRMATLTFSLFSNRVVIRATIRILAISNLNIKLKKLNFFERSCFLTVDLFPIKFKILLYQYVTVLHYFVRY